MAFFLLEKNLNKGREGRTYDLFSCLAGGIGKMESYVCQGHTKKGQSYVDKMSTRICCKDNSN